MMKNIDISEDLLNAALDSKSVLLIKDGVVSNQGSIELGAYRPKTSENQYNWPEPKVA